jgi:transcriptional regulator of nitric oxide reductase
MAQEAGATAMSETYPYVRAAFINYIREEGSKAEACDWLQKQWNEICALNKEIVRVTAILAEKDAEIARARARNAALEKAAQDLVEYASYSEIVGGVSVNRAQIRRECDNVIAAIHALKTPEQS